MRVLLIQAPIAHETGWYAHYPSISLLLLAAMAKNQGCAVQFYDAQLRYDHARIHGDVSLPPIDWSWKPDVIGVGFTTPAYPQAVKIVKQLREKWGSEPIIVAGGPHATALPKETIKDMPGLNAVFAGYAEQPWRLLVSCDCRWKDVLATPQPPKLESLPLPAYNLAKMDGKWLYCGAAPEKRPSYQMISARGCPFHCSFCVSARAHWLTESVESFLEKFEKLVTEQHPYEVFITDDTFNVRPNTAIQMLEGIAEVRKKHSFIVRILCRAEGITEQFLRAAVDAGVWRIFYGVESGTQTMLDKMGKGLTLELIRDAVKRTHEAGISTDCAFCFGMPDDTHETMAATIEFARSLDSYCGFAFATPFPGTDLWDVANKEDLWLKPVEYGELNMTHPIIRTRHLSLEELEIWYRRTTIVSQGRTE